jgi:hypothetical protein
MTMQKISIWGNAAQATCSKCASKDPRWQLCPYCGHQLTVDVWSCANGNASRWLDPERNRIGRTKEYPLNLDFLRSDVVQSNGQLFALANESMLVSWDTNIDPIKSSQIDLSVLSPTELGVAFPWIFVAGPKGVYFTELENWNQASTYVRLSDAMGTISGRFCISNRLGENVFWASGDGSTHYLNRLVAGDHIIKAHKLPGLSHIKSPAYHHKTGTLFTTAQVSGGGWQLLSVSKSGQLDAWDLGEAIDVTAPLVRDESVWLLRRTSSGITTQVLANGTLNTLSTMPQELAAPPTPRWSEPPHIRIGDTVLESGSVLKKQTETSEATIYICYKATA